MKKPRNTCPKCKRDGKVLYHHERTGYFVCSRCWLRLERGERINGEGQ